MGWSDDVLELDIETPNERLGRLLAEQDADLLDMLIQVRKARGLSQQDVAKMLGLSQPTIADFERYENDPKLSTLRRYALAVGAEVRHAVDLFNPAHVDDWDSAVTVRFESFARRKPVARRGWEPVGRTA